MVRARLSFKISLGPKGKERVSIMVDMRYKEGTFLLSESGRPLR